MDLMINYCYMANTMAVDFSLVVCFFHPNGKTSARTTVLTPGLPVESPTNDGQLEGGKTDTCC